MIVDDMIRILRSKLQEQNNKKVSDLDILDFLNQGQDFAFDIIARRYPDSIAAKSPAVLDSGATGTFTLPEDAFEQRLTRVYRKEGNYTIPLERVDYREIDDFTGKQGIPTHYAILKNKVHLLPNENLGNYSFTYAYVQDVEPFVPQQGQIRSLTTEVAAAATFEAVTYTADFSGACGNVIDLVFTGSNDIATVVAAWNAANPTNTVSHDGIGTTIPSATTVELAGGVNASIVVDSLGSDLTISSDSLDRFVNLVDAQTGLVKTSMEVKEINTDTNRVTFKSSSGLTRTTVLNKEITGALDTLVEVDDYICVLSGSCVPYFKKPSSNFIIQWAAAELKRSLGMDAQMEENALRKYEEQMEKVNSGRESTARVYRRRHPRNDRRW